MTQIKYWFFISTLSIALSNDGEGYQFIGNSTQDYYQDIESVFEMNIGPWDFLTNFSGRQTFEFMAPKEKQDEIICKVEWSKVIATSRVGDKVTPNHEAQKQNGTSFTIKNDPITGELISVVGNDEASTQLLEMTEDGIGDLFKGDNQNLLYPFGPDSIRYVGDVWAIEKEAEKDNNFMFEEFEGTEKTKLTYKFNKFKEKKGNKIAYIKLENITEISGVGSNEGKSMDMTITTVVDGKIKFNITTGLTESCKMSMSIVGSGRDLEDDDIKEFSMGLNAKVKQKFK